jgi:ORF6N domain
MARRPTALVISPDRIERRIFMVRGQRVMLDWDLAEAYGVSTKRFNQQVKRNQKRFPPDFAFRLTRQEFTALTSQIVTSNVGRGGRRYLPWVFTEQGVAMLSSVIQSPIAVKVNIEIIRAFVRLRQLFAAPGELVAQITKLARTVELHDDQIKTIADVLRRMMEPPPEPEPKRRFGFQVTP